MCQCRKCVPRLILRSLGKILVQESSLDITKIKPSMIKLIVVCLGSIITWPTSTTCLNMVSITSWTGLMTGRVVSSGERYVSHYNYYSLPCRWQSDIMYSRPLNLPIWMGLGLYFSEVCHLLCTILNYTPATLPYTDLIHMYQYLYSSICVPNLVDCIPCIPPSLLSLPPPLPSPRCTLASC